MGFNTLVIDTCLRKGATEHPTLDQMLKEVSKKARKIFLTCFLFGPWCSS